MCAMALLGAIAFVVIQVSGRGGSHNDKTSRAKFDASMIAHGYAQFFSEYDRWPSSIEELVQPPGGGTPLMKRVPRGPWGRAYRVEFGVRAEPVIVCFGADGQPGGVNANGDVRVSPLER